MKTKSLLVISILLICISGNAQTGRYKYQFRNQITDSVHSGPSGDYGLIYDFLRKAEKDLSGQQKVNPEFDLTPKHIQSDTIIRRRNYSAHVIEEYPGSSKFYAKRGFGKNYIFEKSFIKKPDTTVKYYLIIEDPISHRIIR